SCAKTWEWTATPSACPSLRGCCSSKSSTRRKSNWRSPATITARRYRKNSAGATGPPTPKAFAASSSGSKGIPLNVWAAATLQNGGKPPNRYYPVNQVVNQVLSRKLPIKLRIEKEGIISKVCKNECITRQRSP